jgi:hypothetical protein
MLPVHGSTCRRTWLDERIGDYALVESSGGEAVGKRPSRDSIIGIVVTQPL